MCKTQKKKPKLFLIFFWIFLFYICNKLLHDYESACEIVCVCQVSPTQILRHWCNCKHYNFFRIFVFVFGKKDTLTYSYWRNFTYYNLFGSNTFLSLLLFLSLLFVLHAVVCIREHQVLFVIPLHTGKKCTLPSKVCESVSGDDPGQKCFGIGCLYPSRHYSVCLSAKEYI